MAEGLLRSLYGDSYESYSAGVHPTKVHPFAEEVMKEIGINISKQFSKSIKKFINKKFDCVVTVCDKAQESCPFFPGARKIMHKSFQDPAQFHGSKEEVLNAFRSVRDEISSWIKDEFKETD